MQTVLRKITSLSMLSMRERQGEVQETQGEGQEPLGEEQTPQSTRLSYSQLMQQIDKLEELVDIMLDDAKNDKVLFVSAIIPYSFHRLSMTTQQVTS
jgi:hypothetical protein